MEPTAPDDGGLSAFLDDYFAECDEHLTGVRRLLLDLEASVGRVAPRAVLDELFRHFHSLKGISGMVELRPAEDLAHRMEEYLRSLRQRESVLTSEGLSAFFEGAQLLEQIVGARRSGGSVLVAEAGVARWGERLATTMDRAASAVDPAGSDVDAPAAASPRWRLTFIPSRELVARGVRVDTIRKRIAAVGEIIQATPHVIGEGTIAFEFVVATGKGEEAFAGWQDDGVTAERLPEEPPAIEPDDAGSAAVLEPAGIDSWSGGVAPSHFVRVDLARLDELMRGVGDLVISRARLNEALTRVESHIPSGAWRAVQENAVLIDRQLRTLREGIMRVRLVQVGEIFRRMPFVVRDLARETGKKVQLELRGQSAEIDKFLIERMMDPVLHLVRNAVSHGIETVEERIAAGKRPEGTITLAASTAGETVTLEIADDGRGIDREAIAARAASLGLPMPPPSSEADALLSLICAPGFSTREQTDRASGRGVGMAVVKTVVEELGGTLRLETEPGTGTRFIIELPVTLAITDALIARVGAETFAIPQGAVREVIEVPVGSIRLLEQHEIVPHRGGSLPIVRLARMFGLPAPSRDRLHVFVIGTGAAALGIAVDRIVGQREIVVRASKDPLVRVDGISGATDLGDGHVVLIVDPAVLARRTREGRRAAGVTGWTSKVASQ